MLLRIFFIGLVLYAPLAAAQTRPFIVDLEGPYESGNSFIFNAIDAYPNYNLQFGSSLAAIQFDTVTDQFNFTKSINLQGNEIKNVRLEQLAAAPTCNAASSGRVYFNTTNNDTFSCNDTEWKSLTNGITTSETEQTLDYDSAPTNSIIALSITSANRPAESAFIVKTLGNTNLKTQIATNATQRFFRSFSGGSWSSWQALYTSFYEGYTVEEWGQTDGSISYIRRSRDSDGKWVITKSEVGGFTYAQEENNGGVTDGTTAWTNRLTLTYGPTFTP
jgi:hypothetical protein